MKWEDFVASLEHPPTPLFDEGTSRPKVPRDHSNSNNVRLERLTAKVKGILCSGPGTTKEIAAALGVANPRSSLRKLVEMGIVCKVPTNKKSERDCMGVWRLTTTEDQ
jgi:hypothetical protein